MIASIKELKQSLLGVTARIKAKRKSARMAQALTIADDETAVCLNCSTNLTGPFCHVCGQKDSDLKRPFWTLLWELLDNVFSSDNRLIKTLVLLIVFPGALTKAYMAGMRARFVTPVRLYFVVSILFFLILSVADMAILDVRLFPKIPADTQMMPAPKLSLAPGKKVTTSDVEVGGAGSNIVELDQGGTNISSVEDCGLYTCFVLNNTMPYRIGLAMFMPINGEKRIAITREDFWQYMGGNKSEIEDNSLAWQMLKGIVTMFETPEAFNDQLNKWIPRALFFLVPVFALIMRVFHWGKQRYYMHQLVFSLHFHSFLFLLVMAEMVIVPLWGGSFGMSIFWWGTSLYLIIALAVSQSQGITRSFLKAGFVWVTYFSLMILAIGFAGFVGLLEI